MCICAYDMRIPAGRPPFHVHIGISHVGIQIVFFMHKMIYCCYGAFGTSRAHIDTRTQCFSGRSGIAFVLYWSAGVHRDTLDIFA